MSISLRQCVGLSAALFLIIASCSANEPTKKGSRGTSGSNGSGASSNIGSGGTVGLGGGFNFAGSGGVFEPLDGQITSSAGPTVTVNGTPQTIEFRVEGSGGPITAGVEW